jgi:hypothetical protein
LCLMNRSVGKLLSDPQKNQKNSVAPDPSDVVAFQKYTQRVWSKVAGRPISNNETKQILADFGRFLDALREDHGGQS